MKVTFWDGTGKLSIELDNSANLAIINLIDYRDSRNFRITGDSLLLELFQDALVILELGAPLHSFSGQGGAIRIKQVDNRHLELRGNAREYVEVILGIERLPQLKAAIALLLKLLVEQEAMKRG